jgi:hypothetical protein
MKWWKQWKQILKLLYRRKKHIYIYKVYEIASTASTLVNSEQQNKGINDQ